MLSVQDKTHLKVETLLLRGLQKEVEAGINAEEARIQQPPAYLPGVRESAPCGLSRPRLYMPAQSLCYMLRTFQMKTMIERISMKITCQTCGRWLRNENALTRCLLADHTMPDGESLLCPPEDDIDAIEVYLDILVIQDPTNRKKVVRLLNVVRKKGSLRIRKVPRRPINCKTSGKTLVCMNDVLSCFEAEHQLPMPKELPRGFPADKQFATLYHTIYLCSRVESGEVCYLGRKKAREAKS